MKTIYFIWIVLFVASINAGFGQNIVQSTCLNDTAIYYPDIEEFSYEIALSGMRAENHYFHDSILIPRLFLDSIKNYFSAYYNAMDLSDSIIDYRAFYHYNLEFGVIILIFDEASNRFHKQNEELIITNDTLAHYIDSLNLYAQSYIENEIILSDTNSMINIFGDFSLFYDIPGITRIDLVVAVADFMPCYKSRYGEFKGDKLNIILSDVNYCDSNSYSNIWTYCVTSDCQIEIISIPAGLEESLDEVKINIYPNPFDNQLHIEAVGQLESIKLIGMDGQIYMHSDNIDDTHFVTPDLTEGLYLIELKYSNGNISYKKMIKK